MLDSFRKIDASFEADLKKNIEESVTKACEVFAYLNNKWLKLMSLSIPANEGPANNEGLFDKRRKSSIRAHSDDGEKNEGCESDQNNILQKKRGSIKRLSLTMFKNNLWPISDDPCADPQSEAPANNEGLFDKRRKSSIRAHSDDGEKNEGCESDQNNILQKKRGSIKRLSLTMFKYNLWPISDDPCADPQSVIRGRSGSSILKFSFGDIKIKRRDELTSMLKETISVCMCLQIEKEDLAKAFRNNVYDNMSDLLEYFESTGELKKMIESYKLDVKENSSLINKMVQAFFSNLNL